MVISKIVKLFSWIFAAVSMIVVSSLVKVMYGADSADNSTKNLFSVPTIPTAHADYSGDGGDGTGDDSSDGGSSCAGDSGGGSDGGGSSSGGA